MCRAQRKASGRPPAFWARRRTLCQTRSKFPDSYGPPVSEQKTSSGVAGQPLERHSRLRSARTSAGAIVTSRPFPLFGVVSSQRT